MNFFNTKIITAKTDNLWAIADDLISDLTPKPVLVMALDFQPGSPEEAQLNKMLEACALNKSQYNIISLSEGQPAAWHQLKHALNPKIIFLLGVTPAQLGISALFALNSPNNFDECKWLPSVSLKVLSQNDQLKAQLWNNAMKPVLKENKFGLL